MSANTDPYLWNTITGNTTGQQAASMTSTGVAWWPPSPALAAQMTSPPPPWVVTDMALNESGLVLDAGFQKILVPKGHLKRLLTLIHMAELCELVGVDDDAQ